MIPLVSTVWFSPPLSRTHVQCNSRWNVCLCLILNRCCVRVFWTDLQHNNSMQTSECLNNTEQWVMHLGQFFKKNSVAGKVSKKMLNYRTVIRLKVMSESMPNARWSTEIAAAQPVPFADSYRKQWAPICNARNKQRRKRWTDIQVHKFTLQMQWLDHGNANRELFMMCVPVNLKDSHFIYGIKSDRTAIHVAHLLLVYACDGWCCCFGAISAFVHLILQANWAVRLWNFTEKHLHFLFQAKETPWMKVFDLCCVFFWSFYAVDRCVLSLDWNFYWNFDFNFDLNFDW